MGSVYEEDKLRVKKNKLPLIQKKILICNKFINTIDILR